MKKSWIFGFWKKGMSRELYVYMNPMLFIQVLEAFDIFIASITSHEINITSNKF